METEERMEKVLMTPEKAQELLAKNGLNRRYYEDRANYYYSQMRSGSWMATGDTIKIAPNGDVLDGQHRLGAIIKFGHAVWVWICYDVDPEAFKVMDTGKMRSAGDTLGILGMKSPTQTAATVRSILMFNKGFYSLKDSRMKTGITTKEIVEFTNEHQETIQDVVNYSTTVSKRFQFIPRSSVAMLYYIFSGLNREKCESFFEQYASGVDLHATSPIRALRDKLMQDSVNKSKLDTKERVALAIVAWNAYRTGKEVKMLRVGEKFPTPI